MKYFAPDYYEAFRCAAGGCRHSCCIGWEIDIDEETLEKYRLMEGETGRRIRENIDESGESACFRMAEGERCPFLNENGLCELILSEGPDILCQICADHPRFRNFYADREEIGLGLSCEEAGRLILTWKKPVSLREIFDDGVEDAADEAELALLLLRERLTAVVQDRTIPIIERVQRMLESAGIDAEEPDYDCWADFLIGLERLDDMWAQRLEEMIRTSRIDEGRLTGAECELALEQLMVSLLYRNLPGALQDGDAEGRIEYAALMWKIIRRLWAVCAEKRGEAAIGDLVELARLYSSEIEYSDENIALILDELDRMRMERTDD